ncbi:hypothetical protein RHGRI_011631 [Rhododendron griersonianum]|uniref:Uncharacterized protein n=1 Tax=Rhododendron griersonianum TaxID=479676 RepID=A0AAV6KNB3_9ERIC|nr:hypothetical protein RHGRI_010709 [Rhododendron griersonianum]KAG5552701.1 hypothetical protein RHGRI_010709 [Rhododendron griersonianum]KAG5553818.1 hypothetical protein RHGRI_011631 [Rhododendron griersonianum]KAG5553819.1 hypothetical protein RHGRI_011631 [Rhododendron griersonianum]
MAALLGAGFFAIALVGPASAADLPLITAMALVWQYGEKSGNESWKGLSWGMILVALQAALTVIGNATMCIAAFRIYKSSEGSSKKL